LDELSEFLGGEMLGMAEDEITTMVIGA